MTSTLAEPRRSSRLRTLLFTAAGLIALLLMARLSFSWYASRLLHSAFTKPQVARAQIASIAQQIQLFVADHHDVLPADFALSDLTCGEDAQLRPGDLIDPWGRPYAFIVPGENGSPFAVASYGRNGVPDGTGDDEDVRSDGDADAGDAAHRVPRSG